MTTYQQRYERLRLRGFLQAEARVLANIVSPPPYMKDFVRARGKLLTQWHRTGKDANEYRRMVRIWYDSKGWLYKDKKLNVHAALRHYEDRFRESPAGKDYRTPSYKKARAIAESERKLRRSLEY
jgi:hypothetical protein